MLKLVVSTISLLIKECSWWLFKPSGDLQADLECVYLRPVGHSQRITSV